MACILCEQNLIVDRIYEIGKQNCICKFCNTSLVLNPSKYQYKGIFENLHTFIVLSAVSCPNCYKKLDGLYFPCEDNDPNFQASQSISEEELANLFKVSTRELIVRQP